MYNMQSQWHLLKGIQLKALCSPDTIFVSHNVFSGHMDVNAHIYKPIEICFRTWNELQAQIYVTPIFKP